MAIPLDENVLIFAAAGIFIPLFIFFIKLIIEIGVVKGKIDNLSIQSVDTKKAIDAIIECQSDIRILKIRMDNLEREVRKSPI